MVGYGHFNLEFFMRAVGAIVLAIWSYCLFTQPACAEKRVALVIGNSAYQNVYQLANPVNDSDAMSETLKRAGFDIVELKRNLKANEMRRALRDFSDQVRDANVAVVYYAGHGMEIDGTNYVIPIDAVLERDIDVYDEAISLDRILSVIEPAKDLRLVILDACRDNPFSRSMKRTTASRSIGRGLARVEPNSPNTLIAFSAKAGSTAFDGDSKNSPFTTALINYLIRPGLDLRKVFGFTRDDVLKATNNRQEPFVYGSLGGNDVSLVPALPDPNVAIQHDYELSVQVGTTEVWDAFLSTHPSGFYAKLARSQRDKLAAEAAHVAASEKARLAAEEARLAAEQARLAAEDRARLAAEGARSAEQARAAVEAKTAEQASIDAERKRASEDAKVAEAERFNAAVQARVDEELRLAKVKADQDTKAAREAKAAEEQARASVEKDKTDKYAALESEKAAAEQQTPDGRNPGSDSTQRLAALPNVTIPSDEAAKPTLSSSDIAKSMQIELRRIGCFSGSADGEFTGAFQQSIIRFNKYAGEKLDIKVASLDALEVVKMKSTRICPVSCEHGYRPDGDHCTRVSCGAGEFINGDNECGKRRARAASIGVARTAKTSNQAQENDKPNTPRTKEVYDHCGRWGCFTAAQCVERSKLRACQ